jgi:hypothetical protein
MVHSGHMEPVTQTTTHSAQTTVVTKPARRAAVNGLAIVGFIALIIIGIGIAIYGARMIPSLVGKSGTANVYFSSVFGGDSNKKDDGQLQVVPISDATTTETAAPAATSSAPVPTTPAATTPAPTPKPAPVTVPTKAYIVGGTTSNPAPQNYYGLSDLALTLTVGYMSGSSDDTFVESKTVPSDMRLAARITVVNQGTNVSGPWQLEAVIPTRARSAYDFTSDSLPSLAPGESRTFVIHTDAGEGKSGTLQITLDPQNRVNESNERNNDTVLDIVVK